METPPRTDSGSSSPAATATASQPPAETTMRVVAFCLVLLSTLAGFAVLVYLEDILIPFTFAFFLACVLEPLQRLVIRTGMRVARACAACVASLRKSGGDRERGTAAEREPLTGTHVQQEPIASELVGLSLRQRSPSASAACAVLALRMAGVVVCVLALVSCLTGFVAVSTFELERLATLADTQDWDRRGEALVNETIRLVNRTHLPPSQIEDYVRSGLAEVPGVVKAVLLGLGNFSVDLLLVCVIVFFMLWSRAAAHVHTAAVIDDPLATPRTTEAHRHHQARIEPSRLQGSIQAQIRTYFQLKTLTSLLLGAAVGISLLVLGVPGSGFFGIVTGLVLILDPDIPLTCGFLALALPIGIHTVLANVVEPLLFGAGHGAEGTELDPTIMLISMSVWNNLWGLSGLVLAVPLTICLRLLFHDLDRRQASSTSVFGMLDRMLAGEFVFDGGQSR